MYMVLEGCYVYSYVGGDEYVYTFVGSMWYLGLERIASISLV